MKLLLDTHTLLWFVWAEPQLSPTAKAAILDDANSVFVSVASLWELAIKVNIGKLSLDIPLNDFLHEAVDANGFEVLPIERSHLAAIVTLPLHHRDPFDRLLIAQSLTTAMPLITADAAFDAYGISRLW
jgi:PIN domain nuclease of toxin-antitoxin system